MAADFTRLLSRICSVVNSPPQTLQRQPGDAACAIPAVPLLIGAPGPYQFATALRTLSLNHEVLLGNATSHRGELIAWVNRASLLNCKSGRIAIAVPFQASRVIALVFGVGQRFGFGGSQLSYSHKSPARPCTPRGCAGVLLRLFVLLPTE